VGVLFFGGSAEVRQIHLHPVERLCLHFHWSCDALDEAPAAGLEAEDLERLGGGSNEPEVGHAGAGVLVDLAGAVEGDGAGGEDLADPIGCEVQEGGVGEFGQALATPACQIGDEHLTDDVDLGLVE